MLYVQILIPSSRQPIINEENDFLPDILLDDGYEGNLRKEGRSVRIVVAISSGPKTTKV